jgi:hypothetical protein
MTQVKLQRAWSVLGWVIATRYKSLFDKKKSQLNNADNQKISLFDIRVTVQSLSQRVQQLEDTLQIKEKQNHRDRLLRFFLKSRMSQIYFVR